MAIKHINAAVFAAIAIVAGCRTPEPPAEWDDRLPDPATLKINEGRKIKFAYPLPRMMCGDVRCGTYNNMELSLPGVLTTSDYRLGMFLQKLRETIMANRRLVFVDGKVVVCNLNWIRDHVHIMKGWKHWEYEPLSFLQLIIDTQRKDGQYFELLKQMDDFCWDMVGPESYRLFPEDNMSLVRLELEADIEYLVVEGAWQYYRMIGDDKWLASVLPALEKGIDYQTNDLMRWEPSLGLCIRPYTIDTWDFTNDPASGHDRRIVGKPLCAMHGDNTGVYQAMKQLAWMNRRLCNEAKAAEWDTRAATLRENIMKHLWNGRFFVHQLPVRGTKPLDSNEANRLSLSDAYALNRGILSGDECRTVIDAFVERGKTAGTFSEFFTIDPAYEPSFNRYKPGEFPAGSTRSRGTRRSTSSTTARLANPFRRRRVRAPGARRRSWTRWKRGLLESLMRGWDTMSSSFLRAGALRHTPNCGT